MNYLFADQNNPGGGNWLKEMLLRFCFILPVFILTFVVVIPLFVWHLFDQKRALRVASRLGFYRRRLYRKLAR